MIDNTDIRQPIVIKDFERHDTQRISTRQSQCSPKCGETRKSAETTIIPLDHMHNSSFTKLSRFPTPKNTQYMQVKPVPMEEIFKPDSGTGEGDAPNGLIGDAVPIEIQELGIDSRAVSS